MSRWGSFSWVLALAACGSPSAQPTKPVLTNTVAPQAEQARNDVVKATLAALGAGDLERLVALADPKVMFESAFSCKDGGDKHMDGDAAALETSLREDFKRTIAKLDGAKLDVVSIRNEIRGRSRDDRNATFIAKGGTLSSSCVAKADVLFHEVEIRVRVSHDGSSRETRTKLELVNVRGRWFVSKIPRDLGSGDAASTAVAKMEEFSNRMCACKDKACADQVNEDMTKWGTEMARTAGSHYDERPDPELAKKSADIMTLYTECMTKLMMAGAGTP